jgi:nucleotide-binding universal stress UspA family protein
MDIDTKVPDTYYSMESTNEDVVVVQPGPGGRHILVGMDRSANAWYALKFASHNIIRPQDVVTLFVVLSSSQGKSKKGDDVQYVRTQTMITVHDEVKNFQQKEGVQFKYRVHCLFSDDAKKALLDKAHQSQDKYRMLIVGSRGMSSLAGVLMGSVSTFLLNHCDVPVVVCKVPKE